LAAWVEFNKKVSTTDLFDRAIKQKISISPGRLYTLQDQFENCMRLSLGLYWTDELRNKLKVLGGIVGRM
jgi:DNA-binding transcriptional MocR family regulator